MPDEIGVYISSACFHAAGGLGLYLQTLRRKDGTRAPVDALWVLGMILVALVTGASISMLAVWAWGDTPENRVAIIGINGLVGVGLITARKVIGATGFGESTNGADEPAGGRKSLRPDSDSRRA